MTSPLCILPFHPQVLVGNKVDAQNRAVTTEEAREFAESRSLPFFEASAMTGANVNEAFQALAAQLLQ
jgi:GTPase SAR1 family protein